MNSSAVVDAGLREVMARFATGVTVVTVGGERMHGMTANAFTSVSLDPPQVLCCVAHTTTMHDAITASGSFAVSILAADQEALARYFADRRRPRGAGQFAAVDWHPGPSTGAPLLAGALAWLECDLVTAHASGDHSIFVGAPLGLSRGCAGPALTFYDGVFGRIGPRSAR